MNRSTQLSRKLTGAALLLALAAPSALFAQPPAQAPAANGSGSRSEGSSGRHEHGEGRHRARDGRHEHGRILRRLNLTDAQKAQIRVIRDETRARARQLRESSDREARREEMHALREETRRRVDAVLTQAQRDQAEALRTEAQTARVTRRVAHLQQTLGLSESQTARVRQVFEQAAGRRQAARAAGANVAAEGRRTERERVHAELRQILTAEQMSQLESERGHRRGRHRGRGRHGGAG